MDEDLKKQQEEIDQWKEESRKTFEKGFHMFSLKRLNGDGRYIDDYVQLLWETWLRSGLEHRLVRAMHDINVLKAGIPLI